MAVKAMHKNKIVQYWLPVIACMFFIFYISSLPGSKIPALFQFQDIVFHLLVYSVLALVFLRALKNTFPSMSAIKLLTSTVIFTLFYGLTDEIHQAFVPYRCASFIDVVIDGFGGFSAGMIMHRRAHRE